MNTRIFLKHYLVVSIMSREVSQCLELTSGISSFDNVGKIKVQMSMRFANVGKNCDNNHLQHILILFGVFTKYFINERRLKII